MNTGAAIFSSVLGGMVAGAIGGAAGENSDHPAIKGAVIVGLVNGALTAVLLRGVEIGQTGTSGQLQGAPSTRQVAAGSFP